MIIVIIYIICCFSKQMYPNGKMSHHFRQMKEGDYLAVRGPKVLIAVLNKAK